MKQRSLAKLFTALIGGLSIGAHGSPCGSCPPTYSTTEPLLPKANGPDGGFDGGEEPLDCNAACNGSTLSCRKITVDGGAPLVECIFAESCGAGRRTSGQSRAAGLGVDEYGAWLAATASLERQSIHAFSRLARELTSLGAPRQLVERVRVARSDEVRHSRRMTRLASQRGARPAPSVRVPRERRALGRAIVDIAIENAVEGRVRETFSALLAHHQAVHATDPMLALAMKAIAREETSHAALSHDVHAWLLLRLTKTERARVRHHVREAANKLEIDAAIDLSTETLTLAGLPPPAVSHALARAMIEALELDRG